MGRYGFEVIDADGHGGEPLDWRRRIPDRYRPQMVEYVRALKDHYGIAGRNVPGGGMQVNADNPATTTWSDDDFELGPPSSMRPGMYDPAARVDDMELEGIDTAVLFPPGTGEEFALHDRDFSIALCRTLNDARAEFGSYAPDRIKFVAKLPMIDPEAAAEELERCVTEHGFVGMVCPQHVLDKNLDDPSFDVVWATADALGVAVTVHGGGQAQGQVPFVIERLDSTLTVHAFTHPVGAMLAVTSFTVGGVHDVRVVVAVRAERLHQDGCAHSGIGGERGELIGGARRVAEPLGTHARRSEGITRLVARDDVGVRVDDHRVTK